MLGAGKRAGRLAALAAQPGVNFAIAGVVAMGEGEPAVTGAIPRHRIENVAAHVLAVGAQHVEDVEEHRDPGPPRLGHAAQVDARLEPGEGGPRALERDHLPVDDEVGGRLLLERLRDDLALEPEIER